MTERFIVDIDEAIVDKLNKTEYCTWEVKGVEDICELLNSLNDENEQLKQTIDGVTVDNTKQKKVLNATKKENEQLKSENNMLKVTIGRNEAYIKRLTETSEWHC